MAEGRLPLAPAVWGHVPQRNKNFTCRGDVLAGLRTRLTSEATAGLPHVIHGLGGVGKTQVAVEYCYRQCGDYDLIWWSDATEADLVRSSLAALAPRLGIDVGPACPLDDAVRFVLDALRRGEPSRRWLLVFDNADQPEEVEALLPCGPGHLVVTSRNYRWRSRADAVELEVFSRSESLAFLHHRVPGLSQEDGIRLADEFGDLPLALEQAGALMAETGVAADEYLDLFTHEPDRMLAEDPPADYPTGLAGAWSMSATRLRRDSPVAWELLRRLAFFGPAPITRDLLKQGRFVCGPPLQDELGDPILFGRAARELGRHALARVDNHHRTLQVHRLIQKFVGDWMDADEAHVVQHEVHLMLAAADPGGPDDVANWPCYADLLAHAVPAEAVTCPHPDARRLVRNLVRYLLRIGDLATCDLVSLAAFERWTVDSGADDTDVLVLAGQRANVLWAQGCYHEAYDLRRDTLKRMRVVLGEDHEETLLVTAEHGADLRARGEFLKALKLDASTLATHTRVFGEDHPRTFVVASSVAVDQGLNGDYSTANQTDHSIYEVRLNLVGRNDHPWVVHALGAIARDLRQGGRYQEALRVADKAYVGFLDLVRQRVLPLSHPWVLAQAKDLSVARRQMSHLREALELADEVSTRYARAFDRRHPDVLAASMTLGNACRAYGDVTADGELLARADALVEAAISLYGEVFGEEHPFTLGCALNLAIVRRRIGDEIGARRVLEAALYGLERRLGGTHHYSLLCLTALATSLAALGDVAAARKEGRRALDGLRRAVGDTHPHTLACASNLAIDLRAMGETEESEQLAGATIRRYESILPAEHLDVRAAKQRRRIALDFEPPPI